MSKPTLVEIVESIEPQIGRRAILYGFGVMSLYAIFPALSEGAEKPPETISGPNIAIGSYRKIWN